MLEIESEAGVVEEVVEREAEVVVEVVTPGAAILTQKDAEAFGTVAQDHHHVDVIL
jgi:hypothetical protein